MDLRSWPKRWNEASLRDIAWPKRWSDASLGDIATLPEHSPSRRWPLLGMLALGLVAGAALGGYMSQQSRMKRLAMHAQRVGDELAGMGTVEAVKPVVVGTSSRSNHRPKAASKV